METLKPPRGLEFSGNLSENWKRFWQRFDLYLRATGGDEKDDDVKTAIFLHVIGEEALEIYNGFQWGSAGDDKKLQKVKEKFEEYCIPRTNITFERHRFFTCSQRSGETIDQFVSELQNRAKTCEFGALKDGLIRDRVICGVPSSSLRERLLREEQLTFEKTIRICRAVEATKTQAKELGDVSDEGAASASCGAVHRSKGNNYKPKQSLKVKGLIADSVGINMAQKLAPRMERLVKNVVELDILSSVAEIHSLFRNRKYMP